MKKEAWKPRPQFVCPACQGRLVHRVITLHAESETIIVCEGAWEALPKWMRDGFTEGKKNLARRQEAVREITEHLRLEGRAVTA